MMTTERRTDLWTFRIGGTAAIAGSVLGMLGNLRHPVTPIGDPVGTAQVIAESQTWVPIHLAIVLGILLMVFGLFALLRSITGEPSGALARFGMLAATAGVTIGLVLVITDGVGARQLAEEWARAAAGEQATALRVLLANETINFALGSLFNFVFAGATFILFGLAVALSDVYPRWLGWVGVLAGVESVGAGLIQAFAGEPTPASRLLTIIGPTVITLWLLVMGAVLLRLGRGDRIGNSPEAT